MLRWQEHSAGIVTNGLQKKSKCVDKTNEIYQDSDEDCLSKSMCLCCCFRSFWHVSGVGWRVAKTFGPLSAVYQPQDPYSSKGQKAKEWINVMDI